MATLDEMRALEAKATKGPWSWHSLHDHQPCAKGCASCREGFHDEDHTNYDGYSDALLGAHEVATVGKVGRDNEEILKRGYEEVLRSSDASSYASKIDAKDENRAFIAACREWVPWALRMLKNADHLLKPGALRNELINNGKWREDLEKGSP